MRPLQEHGTKVDFIPASMTSTLQVLDVGINKPFKDLVREQYETFMGSNASNAKPSRRNVTDWIIAAWDSITTESVVHTWKKIGIAVH